MLKLAICDDDNQDCAVLKEYIDQYVFEKSIECLVRVYYSAETFLDSGFSPDILFLDIFMNDKDGLQLGSELRISKRNIIIIYTTSLKEQIVNAVNQIHSFGFLVKPINKMEIYNMLDDAIADCEKLREEERVFYTSEKNTLIDLAVNDIFYFEYFERKVKIVTKKGNYICINETIKKIADKMEPYGFVMSHQSFVVNLYYVNCMTSCTLIMKNGDYVYLSQKRASTVRNKLLEFVKKKTGNGESKI